MFDGIIKNMLTDLARAGLVGFAAYLGLQPNSSTYNEFVAGGLSVFAGVWMWWENRGHQQITDALKNVTNKTTVGAALASPGTGNGGKAIAALSLFVLASLGYGMCGPARAQMAVKAPPVVATPVCATSFCTGFYAGGGFDGNGTNADIIGSGLDNSVFGAGAVPSLQAGYQYWNGSVFIDGEAGIGYLVPSKGVTGAGILAYQEMQLGGKLSGLLGTSAPITVPSALSADLISLYVALGVAEMTGTNGLSSGAGAKFVLGPNALLDLGYRYIPFNNGKNDNLVRVRFSYIFK